MTKHEIKKMIRKLSRRRHKKMKDLIYHLDHKLRHTAEDKEFEIAQLTKEINTLLDRLRN